MPIVRHSNDKIAVVDEQVAANPFLDTADHPAPRADATNIVGTCSVETFAEASGLAWTHEDADGFSQYMRQFYAPNFALRDSRVQPWQYRAGSDAQGGCGADAVALFYHSGHGTMTDDGVYQIPTGGRFDGSAWASSSDMELGNGQARYVFWSTCLSLRVQDGHSPVRTWLPTQQGMRMVFGWETVSYDWEGYGAAFWSRWQAGQTLSSAWLGSGMDGGMTQEPAVAAFGASRDEAMHRVFQERALDTASVDGAWCAWRWLGTHRPTGLSRRLDWPERAQQLVLGALEVTPSKSLRDIARVEALPGGRFLMRFSDQPLPSAASPVAETAALQAAERVVAALDLGPTVVLELDGVRDVRSCAGHLGGIDQDQLDAWIITYRQMVDDVPIISRDNGFVRVTIAADGTVVDAEIACVPIDSVREVPVTRAPVRRGVVPEPAAAAGEHGLAAALHDRLDRLNTVGRSPIQVLDVPGTRRVGYVGSGRWARLAAVESKRLDYGHGLQKLVRVTAYLNG